MTTGLLDKAMALACLWYSWPRMLKVAPCTVVQSYNQIFLAWWATTILYIYGATIQQQTLNTITIHEKCKVDSKENYQRFWEWQGLIYNQTFYTWNCFFSFAFELETYPIVFNILKWIYNVQMSL